LQQKCWKSRSKRALFLKYALDILSFGDAESAVSSYGRELAEMYQKKVMFHTPEGHAAHHFPSFDRRRNPFGQLSDDRRSDRQKSQLFHCSTQT
jgi:hypothetical protein